MIMSFMMVIFFHCSYNSQYFEFMDQIIIVLPFFPDPDPIYKTQWEPSTVLGDLTILSEIEKKTQSLHCSDSLDCSLILGQTFFFNNIFLKISKVMTFYIDIWARQTTILPSRSLTPRESFDWGHQSFETKTLTTRPQCPLMYNALKFSESQEYPLRQSLKLIMKGWHISIHTHTSIYICE